MVRIEYGYDRHIKSWCILVLDGEGNQLASSYVGDMISVRYQIKCFKQEFNTTNVVKIKPY